MDSKFHGLPPFKRIRLMQLQQEEEEEELQCRGCVEVSSSLPTKKRKESRDPHLAVAATTTAIAYCLPAKKRVWALQPDFFAHQPLSPPLDLNVEYKPSSAFEGETEAVKEDNDGDDVAEDDGGGDDDDDDGIVCAVCQSTDGDPSDPIVFCDACDLMVHATCYGNPLVKAIPDDDWFCAQCIVCSSKAKKDRKSSSCCCLCPIKGGALKPTVEGRWAHIVCALLVPEVFFMDVEGREGINCSKVPKKRWEDKCYVCKSKSGCAVECSEPKCPLAFHVSCGLKEDLCIEYREGRKKDAIVAGFCKNHTELWEKQQQTGKFKIVARDERKK